MLVQLIASGLAIGSVYALIALAMVMVYKTSEVPNFALGEMAMISTFVTYTLLTSYGLPFWYALIGALLCALLLGVLFEFVFIRRAKEPNTLNLIIMTLGFQMMLYGLASWKWGAEQRSFPFPISDAEVVQVGGAVVSHLNVASMATALLLMVLLYVFFRFTKLGGAMKATQQNAMAARVNGIPTKRVLSITFGMSSVIGAIAGLLIAPITTLDPTLMWDPLLKGFAAAVLGGMTTLVGAAAGGYLLGVIENLFGAYVSVEFKSVVAFLIIVMVLWFRPSGLFGKHYVRKV
jgi:branched-chain amino acid transport system permease protein